MLPCEIVNLCVFRTRLRFACNNLKGSPYCINYKQVILLLNFYLQTYNKLSYNCYSVNYLGQITGFYIEKKINNQIIVSTKL